MKRMLHIVASPRGAESRTLRVAREAVKRFQSQYPGAVVDELNLFSEHLPPLTIQQVNGKYALLSGKDLSGELKAAWESVERQIQRFLAADVYLISAPMWNFQVPYVLKHYIDIILQPKYLFQYTAQGPEGLVKNKKMVIVTSRGGDYSETSPGHRLDLQAPYLKAVFNFVGIMDLTMIHAQPMDAAGPELREQKIQDAIQRVAKISF